MALMTIKQDHFRMVKEKPEEGSGNKKGEVKKQSNDNSFMFSCPRNRNEVIGRRGCGGINEGLRTGIQLALLINQGLKILRGGGGVW